MSDTPLQTGRRLCVAAPDDIEQRVLVSGLELSPWSDLVWLSPERDAQEIERSLERGDIDGGVLPIDAVARARGTYELIPGLAVGSFGPAGVMALFYPGRIEEVERIESPAPGHAARTLCALLFAANGREIELAASSISVSSTDQPPAVGSFRAGTAVLLTGHRALIARSRWIDHGWNHLDLGEVWHRLTGHPFVWAAWAVRPGTVSRKLYGVLHGARTRGKRKLVETIDAVMGDHEPTRRHAKRALSDWVRYRLGNRELAGIRHFWQQGAQHGLLPQDAELRMLPLAAGSGCQAPRKAR